jgi:hypothetical protein
MNTLRLTKVLAGFAALFVLGSVFGFAVSSRPTVAAATQARWEEQWIRSRLNEDARRLKFTPEQIERARPLYDQMLADIRRVREEAARGLVEAAVKQGRALWQELTPEQQKELEKISAERRLRLKHE